MGMTRASFYNIFNPRLREGGDVGNPTVTVTSVFSIHASAKEATNEAERFIKGVDFSIHASAKEATNEAERFIKGVDFSIHASAKEATSIPGRPNIQSTVFNPRLREGGDNPWRKMA